MEGEETAIFVEDVPVESKYIIDIDKIDFRQPGDAGSTKMSKPRPPFASQRSIPSESRRLVRASHQPGFTVPGLAEFKVSVDFSGESLKMTVV